MILTDGLLLDLFADLLLPTCSARSSLTRVGSHKVLGLVRVDEAIRAPQGVIKAIHFISEMLLKWLYLHLGASFISHTQSLPSGVAENSSPLDLVSSTSPDSLDPAIVSDAALRQEQTGPQTAIRARKAPDNGTVPFDAVSEKALAPRCDIVECASPMVQGNQRRLKPRMDYRMDSPSSNAFIDPSKRRRRTLIW